VALTQLARILLRKKMSSGGDSNIDGKRRY
jgi:hypothetical protein